MLDVKHIRARTGEIIAHRTTEAGEVLGIPAALAVTVLLEHEAPITNSNISSLAGQVSYMGKVAVLADEDDTIWVGVED